MSQVSSGLASTVPSLPPVTLVRRSDLAPIQDVVVDGALHHLGEVREFRQHPVMRRFLPAEKKLSLSWVKLDAGEQLDVHVHPVDSMILVCEGTAKSLGDLECDLAAGDAVLVPAGRRHGFIGSGARGFRGLSIQMEERALYEDPAAPMVRFFPDRTLELAPLARPDAGTEIPDEEHLADKLKRRNRGYLDSCRQNPLFVMARRGHFADPEKRRRFLAYFKIWSDEFQKMVLARRVFSHARPFLRLAEDHLHEEFGHNRMLGNADDAPVRDGALEAYSQWFVFKMLSLGEIEKTVLVHTVIEGAANVFYENLREIFVTQSAKDDAHFRAHHVDDQHYQMGFDTMKALPLVDGERLFEIQHAGWEMIGLLFRRLAELSR